MHDIMNDRTSLKQKKMKKSLKYLLSALALSLLVVSCQKDEEEFDESFLYGKWQLTTKNGNNVASTGEYWEYNSNGTGIFWVESEGYGREEANTFTWTLVKSTMQQVHVMISNPRLPINKSYTVTELNSSTLKYYDNVSIRTDYVFKKTN